MSVIVTDTGFGADDWRGAIAPLAERVDEPGADVSSDTAWGDLDVLLPGVPCSTRDLGSRRATDGNEAPDQVRGAAGTDAAPPTLIRIAFPSFSDGRGFTLARRLRQAGYTGRLRAAGHVLADQYAMARRSGFDEVEITHDLARRQPEEQWLARARWQTHDYQSRLGKRASVAAR